MSSQIFGNYIAGIVLGQLSQSSYVIMMSILTLGSASLFVFLGVPKPFTALSEMTLFESPREKNLT